MNVVDEADGGNNHYSGKEIGIEKEVLCRVDIGSNVGEWNDYSSTRDNIV